MTVFTFEEISLAWFEIVQNSVWLRTSQHLGKNYSQRPDVCRLSVPRVCKDNLRSSVPARLNTACHLSFLFVECVFVVAAVDGNPLLVLFLS